MTRDQRIEAFDKALGLAPPGKDQVEAILKLAATGAHASERTAAPIAAWLAGCSGRSLSEANDLAERVSQPGFARCRGLRMLAPLQLGPGGCPSPMNGSRR